MRYFQDTIAAISTPMGVGAVGIIRLSGHQSLDIVKKLFQGKHKELKPYRLSRGWIKNRNGLPLDEVLVSFMPGPGSYTGEDVVEINCHGNPAIMEAVLEAVMTLGARQAQPGEFTKRSFLNGKMDLTQAEAVLEMINAPTEAGVFLARNKLKGHLAGKINSLGSKLRKLKEQLCLAVDFPEEEIECLSTLEFAENVQECQREIMELITDFERDRIWTEGVLVVLTGKVNAGKSSLMNAIIGRERAIVNEMPGTTRDYLEEAINLRGLPVRLVDTAGLRDAGDEIELKGIEKGKEFIRSADIIVLVMDSTIEPSSHDLEVLKTIEPEKLLIALNKWDLVSSPLDWTLELGQKHPFIFRISAKYGAGLKDLITQIRRSALAGTGSKPEESLVPNLRQKSCLEKASMELMELAKDARARVPYDLLAARLDFACSELDQITGRITPDEVLNSIFDNFCIGK
jgi:tRNA modification GTPase